MNNTLNFSHNTYTSATAGSANTKSTSIIRQNTRISLKSKKRLGSKKTLSVLDPTLMTYIKCKGFGFAVYPLPMSPPATLSWPPPPGEKIKEEINELSQMINLESLICRTQQCERELGPMNSPTIVYFNGHTKIANLHKVRILSEGTQ